LFLNSQKGCYAQYRNHIRGYARFVHLGSS
jgi:hypothetical protein